MSNFEKFDMHFSPRSHAAASFSVRQRAKNFENFSKFLKNFQKPATSYIEFWPSKIRYEFCSTRCEQTGPVGQFAKRHAPVPVADLIRTDHSDQFLIRSGPDQRWSETDQDGQFLIMSD